MFEYQDPFLQEQEKIAGTTPGATSNMVSSGMPAMTTETSSQSKQYIDAARVPDFISAAMAKKKAEESKPRGEDKTYDPTGKTQEQIMAETGQQSTLDKMGSEIQKPQQRYSSKPIVEQQQSYQQPAPQQNTYKPVVEPIVEDKTATKKQANQVLMGDSANQGAFQDKIVPEKKILDNKIIEQPLPNIEQLPKQTQDVVNTVLQKELEQPTPQERKTETQDTVFGGEVTVTARANQPYLNGRENRGTDFAGPEGTKVALPKDAEWEVISSRNDVKERRPEDFSERQNYGWGNSLEVKNTRTGEVVKYSHMKHGSVPDYKPGQVIRGGEVVGAIGNTGNTHGDTGNHLDVEYYDSRGNRHDFLDSPYSKSMFIGGK